MAESEIFSIDCKSFQISIGLKAKYGGGESGK